MSDNLNNRGPQDRQRINVHEKWELDYWTKTLGVTDEELIEAITEVGVSVTAVKAKLGK